MHPPSDLILKFCFLRKARRPHIRNDFFLSTFMIQYLRIQKFRFWSRYISTIPASYCWYFAVDAALCIQYNPRTMNLRIRSTGTYWIWYRILVMTSISIFLPWRRRKSLLSFFEYTNFFNFPQFICSSRTKTNRKRMLIFISFRIQKKLIAKDKSKSYKLLESGKNEIRPCRIPLLDRLDFTSSWKG